MIQAIFVHNNANDLIFLEKGDYFTVTPELFNDFINEKDNFTSWDSPLNWDYECAYECEYIGDFMEMASSQGVIIAQYENGELKIIDKKLWEERKEFYSGRA